MNIVVSQPEALGSVPKSFLVRLPILVEICGIDATLKGEPRAVRRVHIAPRVHDRGAQRKQRDRPILGVSTGPLSDEHPISRVEIVVGEDQCLDGEEQWLPCC